MIPAMRMKAVFLVLFFPSLYLVFIYNKALVSPWKPRMYFVQGMTSQVQAEQRQQWSKEISLRLGKVVDQSSLVITAQQKAGKCTRWNYTTSRKTEKPHNIKSR